MSNGKYRATKVKTIDWEHLSKSTKDHNVIFAIDMAKEDVYAALMIEKDEVIATIKWNHIKESREVINNVLSKLKWSSLAVVMEPSGTYGDSLKYQFQRAGIEVYRINPKKTFDAKELYDGVPSLHDAKSAYIIGRLHLDGNSQLWKETSIQRRNLNALIGTLEIYRSGYQRNLGRLEGKLARHWPEVLQLFALGSVTLEALLIEYGSPHLIARDLIGAKVLMRRIGRSGLREEKIEQVLSSTEYTLGVPCTEVELEALQALAQELQHLRLMHKEAQHCVEKASVEDQDIRCLSRAAGKVTAVVMVAKLGSPVDYESSDSYVKAMGLNLKEKSSGKFKGQLKITKRGPSLVRMYLYFMAMRLIKTDPVVRAWYEKKVSRDGGKVKMKALVAVMRKLAKALWYVGQGVEFDSSLLFNRRALGLK